VHRDLKPENIFMTAGPDGVENVKIGDFGLATSEQSVVDKGTANMDSGDLTRSIGTTAYVAPEVRTGGSGSYTAKVDVSFPTGRRRGHPLTLLDVFPGCHLLRDVFPADEWNGTRSCARGTAEITPCFSRRFQAVR